MFIKITCFIVEQFKIDINKNTQYLYKNLFNSEKHL